MKKEVKTIQFFTEKSELSKISLNEVRGGTAVSDYSSGCPKQHHMAYEDTACISIN